MLQKSSYSSSCLELKSRVKGTIWRNALLNFKFENHSKLLCSIFSKTGVG